MTRGVEPRFGGTVWTDREDPFGWADITGNFRRLFEQAVVGVAGLSQNRPAPGIRRRLWVATDTGDVSVDVGDAWLQVAAGRWSQAPTTGTWRTGDFVVNAAGGSSPWGWTCTEGGTPGTWAPITGGGAGPGGEVYASTIIDSGATGRALIRAADAEAARREMGVEDTRAAVVAATATATPLTIVRRNSDGSLSARTVALGQAPTAAEHAATKGYVDQGVSTRATPQQVADAVNALATVARTGSYNDLRDKPTGGTADLGGEVDPSVNVARYTIVDDGSASQSWPNRWEWLFQAVGADPRLVQWVNEYGELRLTPGRRNTIPFRIFTRPAAADDAATGNQIEVAVARDDRRLLFAVGPTGDVQANNVRGGIVSLAAGAVLPAGLPDGTVVVRY